MKTNAINRGQCVYSKLRLVCFFCADENTSLQWGDELMEAYFLLTAYRAGWREAMGKCQEIHGIVIVCPKCAKSGLRSVEILNP